ncbi:MAG: hypothetical protein ABSD38_20180 [Syntrophorhabdales bacterium]
MQDQYYQETPGPVAPSLNIPIAYKDRAIEISVSAAIWLRISLDLTKNLTICDLG